ncbi:MAG: hypothetical protein A2087_13115 [Spirochaetes bacterium GWD1_61_31]|nr:MAG: hypothetical protein A2Y37_02520 [Spirochaetes bacterium GWB1_60_80]OHD28579.1 MAG: hypothetical protein A2004_03095 [Spirochaetes bacterium GWC1_61_12]OHD39436.1 MAG: hypothetical protein A2087_13115 [Spirochaetes bacterium GWD1_61_31]OHD45489.1 MAG: hypothetical protein A2Y35_02790 [Spirochaetes bacterium GWE1_60_18]OHD58063.1 MAG: hypothetical protein A2Y32_05365 [Spirochaetes bacterium GWF1_60_12]
MAAKILGFSVPVGGLWAEAIDGLRGSVPGSCQVLVGKDACLAAIGRIDVLVDGLLDSADLERAIKLQALFVPFVGVDHLPVAALRSRQVQVYNCHGNAFPVAERALALALASLGRIVEYHNDLRNGQWHGFAAGHGRRDYWQSLQGKRCAVLGCGAVGQALAGLLKAFGCPVAGFRRQANAPPPAGFDLISDRLDDILVDAKLIFITLPLTPATRGLLGRRELALAPGACLVNVGRGDVVDETALYESLCDGSLLGAALDVWYVYPPAGSTMARPARLPIDALPNVVLSPHVGGHSAEAAAGNIRQTAQNLRAWLRGEAVVNRVDLEAGY